MSYSISLESDRLLCRSRRQGVIAARIINTHAWMHEHMRVSLKTSALALGRPGWRLSVEYFEGSAWRTDLASEVWESLIGHLADRSSLEIRTEHGERFRYRWEHGQVYLDEPVMTIWREHSLLAPFPQLEEAEVIHDSPISNTSPRPPQSKDGARGTRKN